MKPPRGLWQCMLAMALAAMACGASSIARGTVVGLVLGVVNEIMAFVLVVLMLRVRADDRRADEPSAVIAVSDDQARAVGASTTAGMVQALLARMPNAVCGCPCGCHTPLVFGNVEVRSHPGPPAHHLLVCRSCANPHGRGAVLSC